MEAFIFFVLGFLFGVASIVTITLHLANKYRQLKKSLVEPKATNTKSSVNERMKRVKDITKEQLDLSSSVDGPQKNALDGKYKNGSIGELKKLDEEKNEILRSLLLDGHDLELTTIDGAGVITKMKLSEYMIYMGIDMTPTAPSKPTKTERMGKFTVHRGGRDDDDGNTTH